MGQDMARRLCSERGHEKTGIMFLPPQSKLMWSQLGTQSLGKMQEVASAAGRRQGSSDGEAQK